MDFDPHRKFLKTIARAYKVEKGATDILDLKFLLMLRLKIKQGFYRV